MVERDGSGELAAEMMREAERRVGRRDARRDGEGLPVPEDGGGKVSLLAVGMPQVEDRRLARRLVVVLTVLSDLPQLEGSGEVGGRRLLAELEVTCGDLPEEEYGLVVLAVEVVQHAELVEDERLVRAQLLRLPNGRRREREEEYERCGAQAAAAAAAVLLVAAPA